MDRNRKTLLPFLLVLLAPSMLALGASNPQKARVFEFEYETTVGPIAAGSGPVHVFVPLVRENEHQRVVSQEVEASIPGSIETESEYGNRFWHGTVAVSDGKPIEVRVTTRVARRVVRGGEAPTREEVEALAQFLEPNERVVVGHPVLEPVLTEVRERAGSEEDAAVSRAIYDWIVENVEYKKVGSGWGNGDTFWACNERYGNCTDFHALFISLARTEGIPARFEMGFPVPDDREQGKIGGYHCWVQFYLPDVGWFPIDASEAFKHPEKRELFYGTHPADRIHFSTGRDLKLGDAHKSAPLNYFIYPHVEVAGERYEGTIEKSFSYRDIAEGAAVSSIRGNRQGSRQQGVASEGVVPTPSEQQRSWRDPWRFPR